MDVVGQAYTTTGKEEGPQEFFHGDDPLFPQGVKEEVFGNQNLTGESSSWD